MVSLLPQTSTNHTASSTMYFESFGTADNLEPIHGTNTMAESNAWNEDNALTAGLAKSNQMNISGLANSQLSHTHSPSIQKQSNLQGNITNIRTNSDGSYDCQNSTGGDAGSNVVVSQSSNRLPSPFDLSFDDPLGSAFPNYMANQTNPQSNLGNPSMKASTTGISQAPNGFQNQRSGRVPSQPQHVSSQSHMISSWQTVGQYPSLGGGNDSSTLLTMVNRQATSSTGPRTNNKIISNRFLLGSRVQPFTRNDDEIDDDDLFKVFDDDLGSHTTKKLQMVRRYEMSMYAFTIAFTNNFMSNILAKNITHQWGWTIARLPTSIQPF